MTLFNCLIATLLLATANAVDPTRIKVAKGVFLPFVNDGIILDTAKNGTIPKEETGLELFLSLGGRGIDTAWSYFNQRAVGAAVRDEKSEKKKGKKVNKSRPVQPGDVDKKKMLRSQPEPRQD